MTRLTVSLDVPERQLVLRIDDCPPILAPFDTRDVAQLGRLSVRYVEAKHDQRGLAAVGSELARWLDGKHAWLTQILDGDLPPPLHLEVRAPARTMTPEHLALVNAPWEVLHERGSFLCIDATSMLIPVRRIGTPVAQLESFGAPLGILFMAAAPADYQLLDFEGEESEILESCRQLSVNLAVEETGTLPELRANLARRGTRTHILHLVCHGQSDPPRLILEDELGNPAPTTPDGIFNAIGPDKARSLGLLFLSACSTAAPDANSLSLALARVNFPAVLGWASTVFDSSARTFAAQLFAELARGDTTLQVAVGQARRAAHRAGFPDWHLARLYLGPHGGGHIIENTKPSASLPTPSVAFLDEANRRLQVASFDTFVGRRTELKSAVRHLRQPSATTLLIYGLGFTGKSSLAARIASRMERHTKIVIHKVFEAQGILESIYNNLGAGLTDWYISTGRSNGGEPWPSESIRLFHYIRDLLDNHLGKDQPILLILDDFEHALCGVDGSHQPTEAHAPLIKALVRAFNTTRSNSRLVITSRFAFTITPRARETDIYTITIADFSHAEAMKRALREPPSGPVLEDLRSRCAIACRGNPALLDLLLRQVRADYKRGKSILEQVERISDSRSTSTDPELRTFLLESALEETRDNASAQQLAAFDVSTWFRAPLPSSMADAICAYCSSTETSVSTAAMTSLGLWMPTSSHTTYFRPTSLLSAISQRDAHTVEPPSELAMRLLPLAHAEARISPGKSLSYDLIRLSDLVSEDWPLPDHALSALAWMTETHALFECLDFAKRLLARAQASATRLDYQTHTYVALMFRNASDVTTYQQCLKTALQQYSEQPEVDGEDADTGILFFEAGVAASRRGEHDDAVRQLEFAYRKTPASHQLSFYVGCQICREHISLLNLDKAAKQLERLAASVEQFDSPRTKVALLECRCDFHLARSEYPEALRLQNQILQFVQQGDDIRSKALVLSQVGEIYMLMGKPKDALDLWTRHARPIFEKLGEVASIAMVDAKIAHLKFRQGSAVEARTILIENVLPHLQVAQFYEQAFAAQLRIAQIDQSLCQFERALETYERVEQELRGSKLTVTYATAISGIASCRVELGDISGGIELLETTAVPLLEKGPPREYNVALSNLAWAYQRARRHADAEKILREQVDTYADLRDAHERGNTCLRLAEVLHDGKIGTVDEVIDYARQAAGQFKASKSRRQLATVARIFAEIEFDNDNHDEALRIIRDEAFSVFIALGDTLSAAQALRVERDMLADLSRHEDAAKTACAQIKIYQRLQRKQDTAVTSGIAAILFSKAGDFLRAKSVLAGLALPIFTELGEQKSLKTAFFQLHLVQFELGDMDGCIDAFASYIRYAVALGDLATIIIDSFNLAKRIQDASGTEQIIEHVGRLLGIAERFCHRVGVEQPVFLETVNQLGLQSYLSPTFPKEP